MTIKQENIKAGKFIGNGVAVSFPFTFKCYAPAHVGAYRLNADGTTVRLTYLTHYTVTLNTPQESTPGGAVLLAAPLAAGTQLMLISEAPYLQTLAARNNDKFYAEVLNDGLDRIVIEILQLKAAADRAVKVPLMSDQTPEEYMDEFWRAWRETLIARDQALDAALRAAQSAAAAAQSAAAAAQSEQNAKASELAAAASAAAAAASAAAAAASAAAAALSEANAAKSAAAAAASAAAAAQSEQNAKASELAAAASAAAAAASAAAALASELAAAASAAAAAASAAAARACEIACESYRDQCLNLASTLSTSSWRGHWLASETYYAGDSVWYDSAVWYAKQDPPPGVPPTIGEFWDTVEMVPKNSPELTGTPKVPTAPEWDESKQIANTEWVYRAITYREPVNEADWSSLYTYSNGLLTQVDCTYKDGIRKIRYGFTYQNGNLINSIALVSKNGTTYKTLCLHIYIYNTDGSIQEVRRIEP